jgi:multiple sugar transport system substrate-binding protein
MFSQNTLRRLTLVLAVLAVLAIVVACATPAPAQPTSAPPTAAPAQPTAAPAQPTSAPPASSVTELKIIWAQWDPANYLQQMGQLYEQEKGVKVTIIQEPWGTFGDRFFTAMAAKSTEWDGVVGDSQWLGTGATSGYYMDMTEFLKSKGIDKTVTPATLTSYGEYPTGSGTYWAYPTEGDADGWAYRKDLFENADEKAAFKAQYGYDLAVPKTYKEFMDIAKFFTRPDKGLYGVGIYTQKDYDAMTMGVENVMFPYGGAWQNDKNEVLGVVNSPQNIEAVQYYKDLYDCCQAPGLSNAFFQETNDAFTSGKAVMIMNYFAFFPALTNPQTNPHAANTGFFSNPAGPGGDRGAALGGQGLSIINFISAERKQAMLDFITWFAEEKNQAKWAELGGYTCNINVLNSETFIKAQPYNPAFAETMTFVKDFWNIPVFGDLLQVTQAEFGKFIVEGQGTAKETMDAIATQHDKILRDNGYIKSQ